MPLKPCTGEARQAMNTFDFSQPQAIDRCAWYLRVSTPKQKLEHQREHVLRYCQDGSINIPGSLLSSLG